MALFYMDLDSESASLPKVLTQQRAGWKSGKRVVFISVWPWCNTDDAISTFAAMWRTDEIGIPQTEDTDLLARAKQTVDALSAWNVNHDEFWGSFWGSIVVRAAGVSRVNQ